jgi:ethanolamine utilization protein EutQ (cupin superfamily)
VVNILSSGPLRVPCGGETFEANPGDFIIFTKGTEIIGEAVNAFTYITAHYSTFDPLIKDREKSSG